MSTQPKYSSVRVPIDHPLAVINSSLNVDGTTVHVRTHRVVLWDKIGPGPHPCHWCGRLVDWAPGQHAHGGSVLNVDHVNGDGQDNRPENLVPSCAGCNIHRTRGTVIQEGEDFILRPDGRRYRAEQRTCAHCGKKFLIAIARLRSEANRGRVAGIYCSSECAHAYG